MPLPMYPKEDRLSRSHIKFVIGIAAGKGGVGKSTVTVNLAHALHEKGYRIGILDADIYGPSLRRMLPEDRLPVQKGKEIVPALCSGIHVISLAYFRNENEAAAVRAPIANGIISQFVNQVIWGDLDFLLIDFPPGTGDIQLTLAQQARLTGAIMVTTPQAVAVMDVKKAANLFDQVKVPLIGVLENMSFYRHLETNQTIPIFGKGGGKRLSLEIGAPFLGEIPIDPDLSLKSDLGKSIFIGPESETANVFLHLASAIADHASALAKETQKDFELVWKEMENPLNIQRKEMLGQTDEKKAYAIKRIEQIDNYSFLIEWNDGVVSNCRLSDMQRRCPCAGCVDERTGQRTNHSIKKDLKATRIKSVGRYALRVQFAEGCSNGIYDFDMLRKLGSSLS